MKKALFPAMLILAAPNSFSQDLTGTWEGILYDQRNPRMLQTAYFFLQVKQADRAVWGVYNITPTYNINANGCQCSVNAVLPKKSNSTAVFYKDHIVKTNINDLQFMFCNYLNSLNMRYILQDSIEYLVGRWYGERLGGFFVLQHIKPITMKNVDVYFPNLKKIIARGAKDAGSIPAQPAIIADTTKPIYEDQRLIDALKNARIRGGKE